MTKLRTVAQLGIALAASTIAVNGFAPPSTGISTNQRTVTTRSPISSLHEQKEGDNNDTKDTNFRLAPGVSNKLLEETVAPFRGLRLFFYGSFASGAFVGGLITASGVAAAMNGLRDDVDLNTEYLNMAIDFGAVALFGILAKFDLDGGAKLAESVEDQVQRKKGQKKLAKGMRERESQLQGLNINVRVTEDGGMKMAPVGVMQEKAKQHVILVAGPGRAIRDALRGAQLNKVNFAMTNILVVPYETGLDEVARASKPDASKGFGNDRPTYETQPYVAEPTGEGWEEFIAAEMDAAAGQAGEKVLEEGIALVVTNDGKVLRRGVGKVPWRQMVDELEEAVTGEKKEGSIPFLEFLEG